MAANLRELGESLLEVTLEGRFGLPVVLISPDGETISIDNYNKTLVGQVLYDTVEVNMDTGGVVVDNNPLVTLRLSSLPRVPLAGENWMVKIPGSPSTTADMEIFQMSKNMPPEVRKSLGIIKIFLEKVTQL